MDIKYTSLKDFELVHNQEDYLFDKCACGGFREMMLDNVNVTVGEKRLEIIGCPLLKCQKCGDIVFSNYIPNRIVSTFRKMDEAGATECRLTSQNERLPDFANSADFIYDSRDLSIPALDIDDDHPNKRGFSCPVYFDRKVLNAFSSDDDYELEFASESYGALKKIGTDGYPYDWWVVFGINKYNHVVIFLGDLDTVCDDQRAISLLKSYNIESDHTIIETELYQAQFNLMFSEPIAEKRIIRLRNIFFRKISTNYGFDLHHLENEVEDKAIRIKKPINFNESELRENIVLLDGVLNEGIDCAELRRLVSVKGNIELQSIKELKTRKLLTKLIEISGKTSDEANVLIAPLFVLNDLRGVFSHLLPTEIVDRLKTNAVQVLSLDSFDDYRKLYDSLINKLYSLYEYLVTIQL